MVIVWEEVLSNFVRSMDTKSKFLSFKEERQPSSAATVNDTKSGGGGGGGGGGE